MANPICVQKSEHYPVSWGPNLSQTSTEYNACALFIYFAELVIDIEIIWSGSPSLKRGHVCIHRHIHRVHLVLTDPVTHLGLLECEEPPLAQRDLQVAVVWVLAADPRRCSKSCQSASAVLHGWERQDSRADFSVFSYTGEGSACQHTSTRWHLKAVDFLFITALLLLFSLLLLPCVWEQPVTKGEKWNHGIGLRKQQLLMILTFKLFCIHCWTNCFFLHWWSRVITVIVLFNSIYCMSCKLDMFYR